MHLYRYRPIYIKGMCLQNIHECRPTHTIFIDIVLPIIMCECVYIYRALITLSLLCVGQRQMQCRPTCNANDFTCIAL